MVFRYSIASSLCESDPTWAIGKALQPVTGTKHMAALTDLDDLAGLLRAIDSYQGTPIVRAALQIAPLVFVRPGELRNMEWSEINLEAATWEIPAEKMKMRLPHIVPLSKQAVEILEGIKPFTGGGRYVFPSPRTNDRPMSNNGILSALRRMGFGKDEMSGHGFRAIARTVLDETLHERVDYIEHQLAHAVKDANGRAYNRTHHLDARRTMMQRWADFLDSLKAGAKVIPFPQKTGTDG